MAEVATLVAELRDIQSHRPDITAEQRSRFDYIENVELPYRDDLLNDTDVEESLSRDVLSGQRNKYVIVYLKNVEKEDKQRIKPLLYTIVWQLVNEWYCAGREKMGLSRAINEMFLSFTSLYVLEQMAKSNPESILPQVHDWAKGYILGKKTGAGFTPAEGFGAFLYNNVDNKAYWIQRYYGLNRVAFLSGKYKAIQERIETEISPRYPYYETDVFKDVKKYLFGQFNYVFDPAGKVNIRKEDNSMYFKEFMDSIEPLGDNYEYIIVSNNGEYRVVDSSSCRVLFDDIYNSVIPCPQKDRKYRKNFYAT